MKTANLFVNILAILAIFIPLQGFAQPQPAAPTIDVVATFVYPQAGVQTRPQKINAAGDLAGEIIFSTGETRGFYRFRNGSFSPPLIEPNDTGSITDVRAINNSREIAGYYIANNFAHGFFLDGSTYTDFDVPGATNTYINALNQAGDFGGSIDINGSNQGYLMIGGLLTSFNIPGAVTTTVYDLNTSNQAVGSYSDSGGLFHGYFRDSDGTLTFPIDPPGSTQTFLFGMNDKGWMVGRYVDDEGVTHGLFLISPAQFLTFDYPGAIFTSLNGINQQGILCGRYEGSDAVEHGIVARVRKTAAD
jgi:hypothetical protein